MARDVPEWIGKTDNSMPPDGVKDRIRDRQGEKCAITGRSFRPGDKVEYDHITPLWLGGRNAESNLQAVLDTAHKGKTKMEASVRAKINSIRAGFDGRVQLRPVAGRTHDLGFRVGRPHINHSCLKAAGIIASMGKET